MASKKERIAELERRVGELTQQVQSLAYKLYDPSGNFSNRHMNLCTDCAKWFPDEFFHICEVSGRSLLVTKGMGGSYGYSYHR